MVVQVNWRLRALAVCCFVGVENHLFNSFYECIIW